MLTKKGSAWFGSAVLAGAFAAASCDAVPERSSGAPSAPASGAATRPALSATANAAPRRVALEDKAMGTRVTIAAFTGDAMPEAVLRPKLDKALAEVRRLE